MLTIRIAQITDAVAIVAIYNQGIADRSATFEAEPRSIEHIEPWLAQSDRYPLLVVTDAIGSVIGWAGLSTYRHRACYDGIGEFSIYLDRAARDQGIGRQLLSALIDAARAHGFWKLVSRVFLFNTASRALCRTCGFREVGVYENHAQLDGQWLDVVIVERLIKENLMPSNPAP